MNYSYDYSTSTSTPMSPAVALGVLLAMLIVACTAAYISGRVARKKGYSFGLFFFLSLVGGFITWIVLACLPYKQVAAQPSDGLFVKA